MKTLKKKLLHKDLTMGSWITLGHPAIAEIMAKAGFDWLTVDMEHSAITLDQTQQLVQVIDLCGCVPLVRVGCNNSNLIKRVMDAGAWGVIVPRVDTPEEAIRAVASVKYPPVGKRGVGLARAQGYGTSFEEYKEWVGEESIVIVQIEHIKAVENLEKILSVEGVDGFIIGPYDLSGSLGVPGQFDHPDVVEALNRVKEISKTSDKPSGFHVVQPDVEQLLVKVNEGYKFIAYSLDILLLGESARAGIVEIKDALK